MIKHIQNGGFEEGMLEMAENEGVISEKDKKRLEYLRSLPRDRTEINWLPDFEIIPPGRD